MMSKSFKGWIEVAKNLREIAEDERLNPGQCSSVKAVAERLPQNGVIIADEVGMGKTRIAVAVAKSVVEAGGRVAILVPPGLGYQWGEELRQLGVEAPSILRSLWQYLNAWEDDDEGNQSQRSWFNENVLLISHVFCNWQTKTNTQGDWRWSLLPATIALVEKKNRSSQRAPRWSKYQHDSRVDVAAKSIVENGDENILLELLELAEWGKESPMFDPGNYGKETPFRKGLEKIIGQGLGDFDLIIIDEAHKSRGQESNLNRLLEHVIAKNKSARRLALTATPIELDIKQWEQILCRINVDAIQVSEVISNYDEAVRKIRQCPNNRKYIDEYKQAAESFKEALSPYLLRRDKRLDESVKIFCKNTKETFDAYRNEEEILIDTEHLSPEWKQAVCAAEALSFATTQSNDIVSKRLRLTLGNGHGLAALIDKTQRNDENIKQEESDKQTEKQNNPSNSPFEDDNIKRQQRANWWKDVMTQPFSEQGDAALYSHPAILKAVEKIEEVCRKGEKVLVFGRFTRPLKALVRLLNAHEMLRCLNSGCPWPQSKVSDAEWPAIKAAQASVDRAELDQRLEKQYKQLEYQRSTFREKLIDNIENGWNGNERARKIFDAFKEDQKNSLPTVVRALQELIDPQENSPAVFSEAFVELIAAASDHDSGDSDVDLDENEAKDLWEDIVARLNEEYPEHPEGRFARLMYGDTKPGTRRFLQTAFNHRHGYPKVLVAQSLVGREGLNLHKACRTVILLHPEWNPGVVEQQIGRVDRIGCLWEKMLKEAIENSGEIPRINVHPVVFQGTYDEKNWQVLRERWDDLRAQLHGIVISSREKENWPDDLSDVIEEINSYAPNFH